MKTNTIIVIVVTLACIFGSILSHSVIEKHQQKANSCLGLYFKIVDNRAHKMKHQGTVHEWSLLAMEVAKENPTVSKNCEETEKHSEGKKYFEEIVRSYDTAHKEECGKTAHIFLEFNKLVQEIGRHNINEVKRKLKEHQG